MMNSPRRRFLVLLSIVLMVLFAGLFLGSMITRDFQHALEGGRTDQVRVVSSEIEGSYAKNKKWDRQDTATDAVLALMLGLQVKVLDARGEVVTDSEKALALLTPEKKARVLAATDFSGDDKSTAYHSYPLFMSGERVGGLDVKFLKAGKEDLLVSRSRKLFLAWSFFIAGLTLALGMLLSRRSAGPIRPVQTAASDSAEKWSRIKPVLNKDTSASLPETGGPVPEKEITSRDAAESNTADTGEKEPEALPDDPLDADDEDMQPLPGDADRITRIVKGLDELEKARSLARSLRKQPLELAQYLAGILDTTRGAVQGMDITFNLECENGLRLSADPACLTGIMTNLLDNAAKAVKKGGAVTVSAAATGDHIVIAVTDTGTGISRKALPHIFERFYRGSGNGIGLGLTIVKELVDACGGKIDVQSTRGKGTIVTVRIPQETGA